MKSSAFLSGLLASAALCGPAFAASPYTNFTFAMVPTLGIESCVPATGRVTITHTPQLEENMHVEVSGLPPNTDFDLFVIQSPTPNFGLSWYMGDMLTDATGKAVADFIGRFNIGTFIVAPGVASAPKVLPDDATTNPTTPPVQIYHLGLWFDSPSDASKAGCGNKVTPFNSSHNAGVQILNTSNFTGNGPLFFVHR
ncbi:MAG TPA: hypothetical protein VME69_02615 [Methylocella sp.]|nr:hypothetical protein [Methylocella sp.]